MHALRQLLGARADDLLAPEERLVVSLDWDGYLAFDEVLGHDCPGPRLCYLDESLEIITTSREHERVKERIHGFIGLFLDQAGLEVFTYGQATMRDAELRIGAEPDDSWGLGTEKPVPDIVVEIALAHGGLDKLELYGRFGVPEVWLWRKGRLEFHVRSEGAYRLTLRSTLLPQLDPELIQRCVAEESWLEARRLFRSGLGAAWREDACANGEASPSSHAP